MKEEEEERHAETSRHRLAVCEEKKIKKRNKKRVFLCKPPTDPFPPTQNPDGARASHQAD